MGLGYLAQVRDKLASFNAAKASTFQRWANSNPGQLTFQEYTVGIKNDLISAANKNDAEDSQLNIEDFKKARFIREMINAIQ